MALLIFKGFSHGIILGAGLIMLLGLLLILFASGEGGFLIGALLLTLIIIYGPNRMRLLIAIKRYDAVMAHHFKLNPPPVEEENELSLDHPIVKRPVQEIIREAAIGAQEALAHRDRIIEKYRRLYEIPLMAGIAFGAIGLIILLVLNPMAPEPPSPTIHFGVR